MDTSEQIDAIAAALSKAQAVIEGASKDKTNPAFRSKYADLASVYDACRDALAANGLAVVQVAESATGETVTINTRLLHASGQWIGGSLTMRPVKADPQGMGSAITYARRYALASIVGVCPEDDDGNAASARHEQPAKAARTPAPPERDNAVENAVAGIICGQDAADIYARWRHFGAKLTAEQRGAVSAALPEDVRSQIGVEIQRAQAEKRRAAQGEQA